MNGPKLAAIIALLVTAALAPGAVSLLTPGEDDAGSGTDAPDGPPGLPITPGGYQGNLTRIVDDRDVYRLDPPSGTVIRVTYQAPLRSPGGNFSAVRAEMHSRYGQHSRWGPPNEVGITAGRGHPILLTFEPTTAFEGLRNKVPYNFTVRFDRPDNVAALDGGLENASAWSVEVDDGGFARVETYVGEYAGEGAVRGDEMSFGEVIYDEPGGECRQWLIRDPHDPPVHQQGRNALEGDDPIWSQGLPEDVPDLPDGPSLPSPTRELHVGRPTFTLAKEVRDGWLNARVGSAESLGVRVVGWIAWNGSRDRVDLDNVSSTARFWTYEDFEGSGPAVQVGPWAYAEDLSLRADMPELRTRFFYVDGRTPELAHAETGVRETRTDVTVPNGSQVPLRDEHARWRPFQGQGKAPPGTWTVHVERSDGMEGDRIRVAQAAFDIPDDCPL